MRLLNCGYDERVMKLNIKVARSMSRYFSNEFFKCTFLTEQQIIT